MDQVESAVEQASSVDRKNQFDDEYASSKAGKTNRFDDYDEDQSEHLYMELKSTATFKDLDIDALVETTSLDEFMAGLMKSDTRKVQKHQTEFDKILSQL